MPDDQWEIQSEKPAPKPPLNMAKASDGAWEVVSEQPAGKPAGTGLLGGSSATMEAQPKAWSRPWFKQKLVNFEDAATEAMPAAGATIGGILGASAGTLGAPGPGSILGATGGAGIGGMAGESAKQLTRRALGFGGPSTADEAAKGIMTEGALQGGITGLTEGMGRLAGPLRGAGATQYERALAPTTIQNKTIAKRITPELIDRGETGSIGALEKRAGQQATQLRPKLDTAIQAMPQSSTAGSGLKVVQDLETLKGKYTVQGMSANPAAVDAITRVQDVVKQYGDDIAPESLRKLKQIFDEPIAARGGFAGGDLTTAYTLKAQKAAANQIRGILGQASPDVAALNKEISFWLDVQKVTRATGLRRAGQEGGLAKVLSPLAGIVAGGGAALAGGTEAGLVSGVATTLAGYGIQAMRSPLWRTTSAVAKDRIADALARGSVEDVTALLARFGLAAASSPRQQILGRPRGQPPGQLTPLGQPLQAGTP